MNSFTNDKKDACPVFDASVQLLLRDCFTSKFLLSQLPFKKAKVLFFMKKAFYDFHKKIVFNIGKNEGSK